MKILLFSIAVKPAYESKSAQTCASYPIIPLGGIQVTGWQTYSYLLSNVNKKSKVPSH